MRTFLSNKRNDLILGADGNLNIISGLAAASQSSEQYMQTRRGEMIYAVDDGIPFDETVWAGTPNVAQFEAAGRARLLQVPSNMEILTFEAVLEGDVLRYTADIRTDSGETTVNG